MRSILVYLLILVTSCTASYAQGCLPNGIRFESHNDMVQFTNNYPDCTILESYLEVGTSFLGGQNNPGILGITPLTQIEEIKGDLRINSYTNLQNFKGLDNLKKIGGNLNIFDGFRLESFEGLESLDTIMGDLILRSRDMLTLDHLNSLKYIGGSIILDGLPITDIDIPNLEHLGGLYLSECNGLLDLNGFNNLTEINSIFIEDLRNLVSISGFTNLKTVNEKLELVGRHDVAEIGGLAGIDSIGMLMFSGTSPVFPSFNGLAEVGDLIYSGTRWTELVEQPNLDTIHNNLVIQYNDLITNVTWGENLKAIKGGLIVTSNDKLTDLEGLNNVPELKDLSITENRVFRILTGFDNYTSMRDVTIDYYAYQILGLQSVEEIENLTLSISGAVEEIDGFRNLTIVHENLTITTPSDNQLDAFDQLVEVGHNFTMNGSLESQFGSAIDAFSSLTTVGEDFNLYLTKDLSDFKNIETVGGALNFEDCRLEDFSDLESLKPVREISISSTELDSYNNLISFANDSTKLRIVDAKGNVNLNGLESLTALKNLIITGDGELESVNGLVGLEVIHDGMWIGGNDNIKSLAPMSSLKTVGDFVLRYTRIETLPDSIEAITGKIDIQGNVTLHNLDGLESLRHLGDGVDFRYSSLRNLNGLSNLESFEGAIYFRRNNSLNDISGLNSIPDPNLIDSIEIWDNERLNECDLDIFCEYLQLLDKESFISNNGERCDSDKIYCPQYSVAGFFFHDENENGIKDESEKPLTYGRAYDFARGQLSLVNEDGRYHFYAFRDSVYTIDYKLIFGSNMEENWKLTSDSSYTVTFSQDDPMNGRYDFGFIPTLVTNECDGFDEDSFDSQKKIDNFPYEFPWCNVLTEDLNIEEDFAYDIIDLTPFDQLSKIEGELRIYDNFALTSLVGLHNIHSIDDDLEISYIPELEDLGGLDQVREVNGRVSIRYNEGLKNLYGIANIDHTNVTNLTILNNDSLAICDVPFVCKYISTNFFSSTIQGNLMECHKNELGGCLDQFFGGTVFYDNNGDKIQGENDYGVSRYPINVNGNTILGTDQGSYYIFGETDEIYNISVDIDPELMLTTDSMSYTEVYEMGETGFDYNFGLQFLEGIKKTSLNLASGPSRCFEVVNYHQRVTNEGSAIVDARLELTLDPRTSLMGSLVDPTGFDTLSNVYWWEIDTLYTFQTINQRLRIQIPDFNSLGDTLKFNLSLYEGDNEEAINSYDYPSIVRCSYDPNDKLVHPMGQGDENYTLFTDSLLTYTIRFQNTGNDYAKNIRITDTLSPLLDLETFNVVNSSFPVLTSMDGPYIEFSFRDIYLPDSTANEPGSHGFVTYEIETISDLEENEIIENTAHIYFDFNPAIVTNTIQNTMVSEYPIVSTIDEQLNLNVRLIPNPTEGWIRIVNHSNYNIKDLKIYNQQGILVSQHDPMDQLNISHLTAGYYVVRVIFDHDIVSLPVVKL